MRYCPYCQRQVHPVMKTNWFILIFMTLITAGLWLIPYVIYYFMFKHGQCPICGSTLGHWR